jgi:Concanavalin A-like lectin/glucanases superfamily/Abnormal spindle-like microcephaly-assoc'd, ASPM-SPD-2-Hydin/Fibronectin type III domain
MLTIRRCWRGSYAGLFALSATFAALQLNVQLVSAQGTITFVQVNSATPQSPSTSVAVPYPAAQGAGDLNVVVVGWNDATAQVLSVVDTLGNSYQRAVGPTVRAGAATQSIYYAANIAAAPANGNTVTVTFSPAAVFADVRIAEYRGIAPVNPVDVTAAAQGASTSSNSGTVTTTNGNDLLVAANMVQNSTTGPGASFTTRVITVPDSDILEDRIVTATGSYSAAAVVSPSGWWIMQMVAFRAAGAAGADTQAPTAPGVPVPTVVSSSQITLTWPAATDNVGVTGYLVDRCAGAGCSTFVQVGTPATASFNDTGLSASTSYSYRVRATDAAANLSPYSVTASATTPAPDTEPPSAPGVLTATAISGTEIDISWSAATDNVGVAGYRVERCEGTGCSAFTKIGTLVTSTTFADASLNTSTSYSYIVRAQDAPGNLGPYTNVASATTLAANPNLVAAYSFDEGSGTTVNDLTGNGNNGTISGATWTPSGKFGKALSFNGNNSLVTIPDAASLRLTTGMTLEAWVNPAAVNAGWKDIIYKGNDNYYLEASSTNGLPVIGITVGSTATETYGAGVLPANTWTFMAATYDGVNLKLFIDGTQVASLPRAGSIITSANPLQIGGDSIWGQVFNGTIDEVRVYNIALSPAQIQADMMTAVNSSSPFLSLSPASLNFGGQAVGSASTPRVVTLTNSGSLPLTVTSITTSGSQALEFTQTDNCIGTLAPLGNCGINVTFTPESGGTRNATLVIADNAPGNPHSLALTGVGTGFSVSPLTTVLTTSQTQQFTVSGAGASGVTWFVDNVAGGTSAIGTVTSTGVYTPPVTAGAHNVTVTTTDGQKSATAAVYIVTSAGMYTHHNDNARTGQNLNETVLSLSKVNTSSFGKLASATTDGIAHASPLYVANVSIPGVGFRNVVYVATEHDSVYAFDADGRSSTPLWQRSFINPAAGITSVPNGDTGECCDIMPEIGITGTPVIDPATNTLYVVVKTKEMSGSTANYPHRLHALDIATGAEKFGGPVVIQASVPGTGVDSSNGQLQFDSLRENQRTALLLYNGVVYFGFGSHGDIEPYHGWLLGYNATTLQRVLAFCTTPNGEGGGIWQSGGGLAIDSAGNFFFATGDGSFTVNGGGVDYGDTFLKFNPATGVVDYFTPHDQSNLDLNNLDLDAGGMILLPDQPGAHPHVMVSAGKNGSIYVVDRDNLTHYHPTDQNVQTIANAFPFGTPLPGNYSSPVYFNGSVYFGPVSDVVQAFRLTNGLLSTTPSSTTPQAFPYPGGSLAISANGTANGILWAVQKNGSAKGTLHAYDAGNLASELYNSDQAGTRDTLDAPAAKFSIPLVINGRVYVASEGKLTIYGLLP